MAVRSPTITHNGDKSVIKVVWAGLLNGDTGAPFSMGAWCDRSIHVSGTFGVGGSCTMKGSNNETTYIALTDPQGNAITATSEKIEAVTELTWLVRPEVTAGDGDTDLTVTMVARRGDGLRSR